VQLDDIVVTDVDTDEVITATLTLADPNAGLLTVGTFGSASISYNNGTGVWSVSGNVTDVNAALASVAFIPTTNQDVNTSISTRIRDAADNGPTDGFIVLNVNPVNDAPTVTNLNQTHNFTEGVSSVALDNVVITEVDTVETITATFTLADPSTGSLSTGTFGESTSTYDSNTGIWTVAGTVAEVNSALAAVVYIPNADNDVSTTITTYIEDAAGTGPADGKINLNVTAVNDVPTATNLTQTQEYTEGDTNVSFDDILVTDVDSGETVTAILTLADTATGILTTGTFGSSTSTYDPSTGVWRVAGTVADVNAALAAVAFTPASSNVTDTTITTRITDAAGDGPADGEITLLVNDIPSATNLTQTHQYIEGASNVALDDIVISDVDTGETITATLTLAQPIVGTLTTTAAGTASSSFDNASGILTISGTVADVNATLASLVFNPNTDNEVDTTITTRIRDAADTGPADGLISLNVTAVNDAPTATNLSQTKTYTEDASSVAIDDIVISDVDSNETITATLNLQDPDTGRLSTATFGASTSTYNASSGIWQVIGTVSDVNQALAAVAYIPNADNDISTTIATHIEDATGSGPADGVITLNAIAVNDVATATNLNQTQNYTEGDASVALDNIVITDIDSASVTATLTLANPATGRLTTGNFGSATSSYSNGVWSITGSVAEVNAALASVAFIPDADNILDTTISSRIRDAEGTGPTDGTITLSVDPLGQPSQPTANVAPTAPAVITIDSEVSEPDADSGDSSPVAAAVVIDSTSPTTTIATADSAAAQAGDASTAAVIAGDNQAAPLSLQEQKQLLSAAGSQQVIADLAASGKAQLANALSAVRNGDIQTQADFLEQLDEGASTEEIRSQLLLFDVIQKEARTELYENALGELSERERSNFLLDSAGDFGLEELTSKNVAILIGVNEYSGPIPDLATPLDDVRAIGDTLNAKGYQSIVLENAKFNDLLALLNNIEQLVTEEHNVMLYFAGHGYLNEANNTGYWLFGDSSVDSADKWMSTREVGDYLAKLKSKQMMVVSDSCFSGTLTREYQFTSDSVGLSVEQILERRAVITLSSGGEEPVMDGGGDGHSAFASNFISALQETDEVETGFELFTKVKQGVKDISPQTPAYGALISAGHESGGDYLVQNQ